jgi:hypothetical protein
MPEHDRSKFENLVNWSSASSTCVVWWPSGSMLPMNAVHGVQYHRGQLAQGIDVSPPSCPGGPTVSSHREGHFSTGPNRPDRATSAFLPGFARDRPAPASRRSRRIRAPAQTTGAKTADRRERESAARGFVRRFRPFSSISSTGASSHIERSRSM